MAIQSTQSIVKAQKVEETLFCLVYPLTLSQSSSLSHRLFPSSFELGQARNCPNSQLYSHAIVQLIFLFKKREDKRCEYTNEAYHDREHRRRVDKQSSNNKALEKWGRVTRSYI